MKIAVAALTGAIWFTSPAFGQSGVKRFEAGPIVSTASVDEHGLSLGYGARIGFNVSRVIGIESYFARHPLPSFESSPGTVVDERSFFRAGLDTKLTRRFTKYPLAAFVVGGPAFLRSSARWTYTFLRAFRNASKTETLNCTLAAESNCKFGHNG